MSRKIYFLSFVILLGILFWISSSELKKTKIQKQIDKISEKVNETVEDSFSFDDLKKEYSNKDIIGLLKFANQNVLITKTNDNEYYLNHLVDKSYNILGNPFLDFRNNLDDKKIILYGHNAHRYNTPFKVLEKYLDEEFYIENSKIEFITEADTYIYEIFSIAIFNNDYEYSNLDIKDYGKHYEYLKNNSVFDTGISIDSSDDIIVLQTCSNLKHNSYVVISGKKIK